VFPEAYWLPPRSSDLPANSTQPVFLASTILLSAKTLRQVLICVIYPFATLASVHQN
jgi:hypothetical protein